jgi:hypothetical protein
LVIFYKDDLTDLKETIGRFITSSPPGEEEDVVKGLNLK